LRTSARLILIFIISGIVITLLLSWIIEFYKYQNRLVSVQDIENLIQDVIRVVENVYPYDKRLKVAQEIKDEYEKVRYSLKRKLLPIEVFKVVQPLACIVKDQNLRFLTPVEPVYSVLPFTVTVIDGRAIITGSAVESIKAGDELLKVNERPVFELIKALLPYTCGENLHVREQQLGQLFQLIPEILDKKKHSVGIFYRQKDYNITIKTSAGEEKVVSTNT